jgi:hypothetical protein
MKTRLLVFIIISLIIALATYSIRLIHIESSWFERSSSIQIASYWLSITFPLLIILVFFNKFIKVIASITILVLVLCLVYGFYYLGSEEMLTNFLKMTIGYIISILLLIIILIKYNSWQKIN